MNLEGWCLCEGVLEPEPVGDTDVDPAFAPDPDADAAAEDEEGFLRAIMSLSEYKRS